MSGYTKFERRWKADAPRAAFMPPSPRPFDRAEGLRTFERLTKRAYPVPDWSSAGMPIVPSRQEAIFWLHAVSAIAIAREALPGHSKEVYDAQRAAARFELAALDLNGSLAYASIVRRTAASVAPSGFQTLFPELASILSALLDPPQVLSLILDEANEKAAAWTYVDEIRRIARRTEPAHAALSLSDVPVGHLPDEIRAYIQSTQEDTGSEREAPQPAPGTVLEIWMKQYSGHRSTAIGNRAHLSHALAAGFAFYVAPFLDAAAFQQARDIVEPVIRRGMARPPFLGFSPHNSFPAAFYLAAALRLDAYIEPIVETLLQAPAVTCYLPYLPAMLFGLNDGNAIVAHSRLLLVRLANPSAVRVWLATTDDTGLEFACEQSALHATESNARAFVDAVAALATPAVPDAVLGLTTTPQLYIASRDWLESHGSIARATLDEAAKTTSAIGDTAKEILQRLDRSAEQVRPADRPARRKLLRWLYADALPPLIVDGRRLDDEQVDATIDALRASTLTALDPRVAELKRDAAPASVEQFALALLRQWLRAGAPTVDKWALLAIGILGGDSAATALAQLIRRWPGESQHARAVIGLDCLRAIGSDVALTQIAGLAQKLRFAALKKRAGESMEHVARARELSRDRLEDRIVPALDLTADERTLILRGTTYRVRVDDALAPTLRDAHGKPVRDLPKRSSAETEDDAAARAGWKAFKQQLRDVARIQTDRLENAMVSQRSWFTDEFTTLLVDHPIVGRLVRRLLWVAERPDETRAAIFRVRPDGSAADVDDAPIVLPALGTIRLAHRLELSDAELDGWETRFRALGIEQPFVQLDRVTYRLDDVELAGDAILRFNSVPVAEPTLLARLRARGWQRTTPADGGGYIHHRKYFERAGVTAFLGHDMIFIGYVQPENRIALQGCRFVHGPDPLEPPAGDAMRLRDVPGVPISEVCADCTFVLG